MNTLLIILFGLLHVADGVITYLGLSFDLVDEANPILVFFAELLGLGVSITALKLLCLSVLAFLFYDRHKMKSRWITAALTSAVSFYSWVVSSNVLLVVSA